MRGRAVRGGGVLPPSLANKEEGVEAGCLRHVKLTSPAPAGIPAGRGRVVGGCQRTWPMGESGKDELSYRMMRFMFVFFADNTRKKSLTKLQMLPCED